MRVLGRSLLALSVLVLAAGVVLGISYYKFYGWGGWREEISQGWWILAVAAGPAIACYLVLRIARDSSEKPSSRTRP